MIRELTIRHFKSIRSLSIPCRRVNVVIGAPDTGKTNILDALQFICRLGWALPINEVLRLREDRGFTGLFHRQFVDTPFTIQFSYARPVSSPPREYKITASIGDDETHLNIRYQRPGASAATGTTVAFREAADMSDLRFVRFYAYSSSSDWKYRSDVPHSSTLVYPIRGANLLYLARHNSKVYGLLRQWLASTALKVRFDAARSTFVVSEIRDDEIFDYDLDLLSDTFKRLFFYSAIVTTSENAIVSFDEPDVYAFPPYPKALGEMIADDEVNQYFVTTHNPYFLTGILSKTPSKDLALFVCHRSDDGSTALKLIEDERISQVVEEGASFFFNLDHFLSAAE